MSKTTQSLLFVKAFFCSRLVLVFVLFQEDTISFLLLKELSLQQSAAYLSSPCHTLLKSHALCNFKLERIDELVELRSSGLQYSTLSWGNAALKSQPGLAKYMFLMGLLHQDMCMTTVTTKGSPAQGLPVFLSRQSSPDDKTTSSGRRGALAMNSPWPMGVAY